jgi:hypothetical protein
MGMFDEVVCKYPLPGTTETDFQTKSFDNMMFKYTITEDGRLLEETHEYDVVPEEERPYYGKPEWETNPIVSIFGSLKRVNTKEEQIDFHGWMEIHTIDKDNNWLAYEIKFTDGKVVEVKDVRR